MGLVTLLTEEQFLNLPDEPGKRELIGGELVESPPAKHFHGIVAKRLIHLLESSLDPRRVWREEPYHLRKGRWLIPDVSVSWPDQAVQDDWFIGAPAVAIEIASRGNTADEIDWKVAVYLEHGASEVWVLYPKTNWMIVFRKDSTDRIAADAAYHSDLLGLTVSATDRKPAP